MKKILFFLTAAMMAMSLLAAPVDQATAMRKAQSFLTNQLYAGKMMSPAALNPVLIKAEFGNVKYSEPVYYIYNTATTFIVVAGDDRAEEILMVGDRPLDDVNNLPLGLQDLLGQYKNQIMYLQEHPGMNSKVLLSPSTTPKLRAGTYGPLLTAIWDQEAPFYNQCKFGSYQCLTGCPATSASMVFHYWKYPTAATPAVPGYKSTISYSSYGSTSYTHSALPSTTFDWANMLDDYTGSYTTAQGTAVATLMRYVGQAERMGYGTSAAGGSGVSVDSVCNIRDAFTFFGYDSSTTRFVKKTSAYSGGTTLYSDSQWAALIQEEMAAGRPIVFCAVSSNAGGHAFNVDGYNSSTNKYHVNFGWSGSGNAWCSLNAFGYSSYNFNVYQQMVIGIKPPTSSATPTLTVSPSTLSFSTTAGQTVSKTFTVTGTNLTGNVSLALTDANGVYSISPSTITASAAASGATVTVTYKPTAAGSHAATVKLTSSGATAVNVSMSGTATAAALETYTPVMSAANSSYITTNSFRANWTDQTSSANVASYTLQVTEKGSTPATTELANIDLSGVTQVTNSEGYLSDVSSSITSYLGSGWTASTYVYANTGMLITGGNLVSPTYSLTGYSKVTVKVKAYSYYSSYYGNATLSVGTGSATQTQALTDNNTEYTFVLNCSSSDKVTIGSTSNYISVSNIQIIAGDASVNMLAASETGGETSRTITGITSKYYTVSNLKEGASFVYKVKAIYTDGSESAWSNEQEVTLNEAVVATPTLTVTPTSLNMSAYTGETATATFKVTGADLTGNVTLTKSGSSVFSITPTTITAANAANGVNVTVTYAPTATGTQTGTITIASSGAESKTVALTGTATTAPITTYTPVMSAANSNYITSSAFRADWTDQTASANVASYTLQVNGQGGSTPSTGTTLLGTIDGSSYTGSYKTISLTSPWGGSNVKGGNNAVYFTKSGKITFTIPSGYSNATFSVKITTVTGSYGTGNVTVASTKTSAVGHTFAKGETYTWTVTGSTGDVITLTTTDSSYSPDMALIEVYAGNTTLNATETGDATARTITGITSKYYTVQNLTAGATYTYKVKAIYTDGSESAWSNEQTVTLKDEEPAATPTLTVTPASLSMSANVGATKTATFKVTGADLTGNVTLSLSGASVFSISTTSITAANAANGVNVTVTYAPTAYGTQTATVTVASSGATSKTVALTGNATIDKATPVLNAATNISSTGFTANWTHDVSASSVSSYTLYGTLTAQPGGDDEPTTTLLGTIDGSNYTGSYATVTLTSPWSGTNVKGGNGAVYTKNSSSSWWWSSTTTYGYIYFTIPSGYTNATFTVMVTTANNSYGTGNITVKSAKTSAVGHTFAKGETYAWTVTGSAGDVITLYSTDSSYSPDMTLIQVYAGTASLNATATGDNTDFVITDIEAGSTGITLSNLVEGGTYSYYLVANYVDGTTATSNTQEVTLVSLNVNPNTAINSIAADGDEIDSVTYVNMNGVQSKQPFDGVNIVVTRYKNGVVKSSKVLF
ncbi:MAG: C10 family peptidase [Muribaculaceae bacterium]|nr:C10 family peptidase [Muribaculaceae bacterium]